MRPWLFLVFAVAAGCVAATPGAPPSVDHPADAFPAPPGFAGARIGDGAWEFRGRGTPAQAALYFQVSCVEFLGWRLAADRTGDDGARILEFTRGPERLRVEVHAAGAADTLRVLVALARGGSPAPETTSGHLDAQAGSRD